MKIYDFPLSPHSRQVRAIVYELGLTPEFVTVNLFQGEQRSADILRLNANGKVPILVDGDFVLWESNAIVNYLAHGSALLPTGARERADVERWCDWHLAHLGPAISKVGFQRFVKPLTGQGAPLRHLHARARALTRQQRIRRRPALGRRLHPGVHVLARHDLRARVVALPARQCVARAPARAREYAARHCGRQRRPAEPQSSPRHGQLS
jgi:glutathione S-transferase